MIRTLIGIFFYTLFFMTLLSDLVIVWGRPIYFRFCKISRPPAAAITHLVLGCGGRARFGLYGRRSPLAVPIFAALAITSHNSDVLRFIGAAMFSTICFLL